MNIDSIKNKIVTGIEYIVIGGLISVLGVSIVAAIYNLICNL
jgi:Flp pilus assembly pilin Flp